MPQLWKTLTVSLLAGFVSVGCSKKESVVSFQQDVVPILADHCLACHSTGGKGFTKTGLDMSSYDSLMRGTKFGPVIVQGDSISSTLMRLIEHKADPSISMPYHQDRLPGAHIETIRAWIDQGAKHN